MIASKIAPGINATCKDTREREMFVMITPINRRMKPRSLFGEKSDDSVEGEE